MEQRPRAGRDRRIPVAKPRDQGNAAYEMPKDGNTHSIYAGALWMGGISPDQQLKLAAIVPRQRQRLLARTH